MSTTIETKSSASIRIDTDLLEGIWQGLREVKMIKEGKLKAKSADELFDELFFPFFGNLVYSKFSTQDSSCYCCIGIRISS